MTTLRTCALITLPLALVSAALTATPALADGGGSEVRASGPCSQGSTWKLKAKTDDGRLEAELEVDGRAGQTWSWRLTDNGDLVARGTAQTAGPSGSFSRERRLADQPGVDVLRLRAVRAGGGETCTGTLRFPA
ncbi:MAG TPA: hypothetical protein VFR07_03760 [Mycobacteriales bacterium]|nr:hypothetical protein [Mycobacteriales bacterium]